MARMPEPHIFDSVTAPTDCGSPAPSTAWRAGAWPCPAIRQLPISASLTASPVMPARSTAALMAMAPSWCAASELKSPSKPPIGVRAAETMTMGSFMEDPFQPAGPAPAVETGRALRVGARAVSNRARKAAWIGSGKYRASSADQAGRRGAEEQNRVMAPRHRGESACARRTETRRARSRRGCAPCGPARTRLPAGRRGVS